MSISVPDPPTLPVAAVAGLIPCQQKIADQVLEAARRCVGEIVLKIDCSFGRTTILRSIHQSQPRGASALVEVSKLMKSLMSSRAMPMEESFLY
jgi:hypothetical protein